MALFQTDLKGSLPASVVNLAANSQPLLLASLKNLMEKDKKRGENKRPLNRPADYAGKAVDDFFAIDTVDY
jgi:hypothetical protein